MIVIVTAKELYAAVKKVRRIKFRSLPILNYARIALTKDGMKITTTDIEDPTTTVIDYSYSGRLQRWATCVPMSIQVTGCWGPHRSSKESTREFHPFLDWLKVAAAYKETLYLDFDSKKEILIVTVGTNSRTEFKCVNADEFPPAEGRYV